MAGHHLILLIEGDWTIEAEGLDAPGDLGHLLGPVGSRIPRGRPEIRQLAVGQLAFAEPPGPAETASSGPIPIPRWSDRAGTFGRTLFVQCRA